MISYEPFWKTLADSNESTYTLIYKHSINANTLRRIRKNLPLTTTTLDDLCNILKCNVENIVTHVPDPPDKGTGNTRIKQQNEK